MSWSVCNKQTARANSRVTANQRIIVESECSSHPWALLYPLIHPRTHKNTWEQRFWGKDSGAGSLTTLLQDLGTCLQPLGISGSRTRNEANAMTLQQDCAQCIRVPLWQWAFSPPERGGCATNCYSAPKFSPFSTIPPKTKKGCNL